ncbi:MAG: hypothetical protein K9J17_02345 [Flavobacteriales bacterium]|nr:hypothetical protein [Flavobacteriales bacterium]
MLFITDDGIEKQYQIIDVRNDKREVYPHMSLCEGSDAMGELSIDEFVQLKWTNTEDSSDYLGIDINCGGIIFGFNRPFSGDPIYWYLDLLKYRYTNSVVDSANRMISEVKQIGNYVRYDKAYGRCVGWFYFDLETQDTLYQFVISRDLGPIYLKPKGEVGMLRALN